MAIDFKATWADKILHRLKAINLRHRWVMPTVMGASGAGSGAYVASRNVPEKNKTKAMLLGAGAGLGAGLLSGYFMDRAIHKFNSPEAIKAQTTIHDMLSKGSISEPKDIIAFSDAIRQSPHGALNTDVNNLALSAIANTYGMGLPLGVNALLRKEKE